MDILVIILVFPYRYFLTLESPKHKSNQKYIFIYIIKENKTGKEKNSHVFSTKPQK